MFRVEAERWHGGGFRIRVPVYNDMYVYCLSFSRVSDLVRFSICRTLSVWSSLYETRRDDPAVYCSFSETNFKVSAAVSMSVIQHTY